MMTLLKLRERGHGPASDTEAEKTWTERERAYNMKYKTHTYTREGTMKNLRRRDLPWSASAGKPEEESKILYRR